MPELKRLTTMIPFLAVDAGDWIVCAARDRQIVPVKSDDRDCLLLDVYAHGDGPLPSADDIMGMLSSTASQVLVGYTKAFKESVPTELGLPLRTPLLVTFGGMKALGGGKKYAQWTITEIVLSADERQSLGW